MATAPRRRTSAGNNTPAPRRGGSSNFRGAAGLQQAEREFQRQEQRQEQRKMQSKEPMRFFCTVGETREIVIVDEAPDFFRYEYALKNPNSGRYDWFLPCNDIQGDCPVRPKSEREPYWAMYLTILDLTPYENRDGETVNWSKKLLVVKPNQQKKILRWLEREGNLRGMILEMTRDGDRDASIGGDIQFVGFMSEDELLEHETFYKDREGKEHDVIGHEPFDYEEFMPEMSDDELRELVGGSAPLGNRRSEERGTDRPSRSSGGRSAPTSRRGGRAPDDDRAGRTTRGRREEAADDDYPEDDASEDRAPARRGRAVAPARRGRTDRSERTERIDPDDLPDAGEDYPEDDQPAPRRGQATRGPARRVRQSEDDAPWQEGDDHPEDGHEDQPTASRGSRRAVLRRGR